MIEKLLAAEASEAAARLAREFAAAFPPTLEGSMSRKAEDIRGRALKKLLDDAGALQRERPMGLLRRIVFGRVFQKTMAGAGFSGSLIRSVTADVLARITFAGRT